MTVGSSWVGRLPPPFLVGFSELAASSLNLQIMDWFNTSDWGELQCNRQEVLLQLMDVVGAAGTPFAFSTATVHLASLPPAHSGSPNGG